MSLKQDIEERMKASLKAGDRTRLSTLRMLLSGINNDEIAKQREATDEDVISVVQKQVKQHRESIEAYQKGGRTELAGQEEEELNILNTYLPQQLSDEELKNIVSGEIRKLPEEDKNNFGRVMGAVMASVKGKADGGSVSRVVKELLA